MMNRLPVQRCQYCGWEDIGLGWQHGEALFCTGAWLSLTSFHLWGKNAKVAPQNKNKALGVKWHGKKTTVR